MAHRYPVHVSDKWHNSLVERFPEARAIFDAQVASYTPKGIEPGSYPPWLGVGQAQLNLAMVYTDMFPEEARAWYLGTAGKPMDHEMFETMLALEQFAYNAGVGGEIPTAEELVLMREWERSRQVLRFDPDFADAVASSSGALQMSAEVLDRLPYDTFFVERPARVEPASWRKEGGSVVVDPAVDSAGFFVMRTQMALNPHDPLDLSEQLLVMWVDMRGRRVCHELLSTGCSSIGEMIEESDAYMDVALDDMRGSWGADVPTKEESDAVSSQLMGGRLERVTEAMALLLYLCSMEPEYEAAVPGGSPKAMRKKGGEGSGLTGDTPVTVVGTRIGDAIRAYLASEGAGDGPEGDGDGPKVRPHVRRGHFHRHWRGPRNEKELVVMWHAPTFVNAGFGTAQGVTTVHRVSRK